jgi:hypothetical protein
MWGTAALMVMTKKKSTRHVLKRLNLICQKDALLNAFYNMQVSVDLLAMKMDEVLIKAFQTSDEEG